MSSGNFFWSNIKLIVIETLLIKNNVAWFTIYIYVLCHANMIILWCVWVMRC